MSLSPQDLNRRIDRLEEALRRRPTATVDIHEAWTTDPALGAMVAPETALAGSLLLTPLFVTGRIHVARLAVAVQRSNPVGSSSAAVALYRAHPRLDRDYPTERWRSIEYRLLGVGKEGIVVADSDTLYRAVATFSPEIVLEPGFGYAVGWEYSDDVIQFHGGDATPGANSVRPVFVAEEVPDRIGHFPPVVRRSATTDGAFPAFVLRSPTGLALAGDPEYD